MSPDRTLRSVTLPYSKKMSLTLSSGGWYNFKGEGRFLIIAQTANARSPLFCLLARRPADCWQRTHNPGSIFSCLSNPSVLTLVYRGRWRNSLISYKPFHHRFLARCQLHLAPINFDQAFRPLGRIWLAAFHHFRRLCFHRRVDVSEGWDNSTRRVMCAVLLGLA